MINKETFVLNFNFASNISFRSTPLREKARIKIRASDYRIRMAQKLTDPEHC
jgi:hypothetical protein